MEKREIKRSAMKLQSQKQREENELQAKVLILQMIQLIKKERLVIEM